MIKFGLGLRPAHYQEIIETRPTVDWFEVLTEDFIHFGGVDFAALEIIRKDYPISLHGVALSIGSCDPLNKRYLVELKKLIDYVQPISVSDHFCWTGINHINMHDLLPLPHTREAVDHVVSRIQQVQDFLGRQIMLENVSSYVAYQHAEMTEWEFITEITERADCFILLDINNIYVNAFNHGFSAIDYLYKIPVERVKQFHLAGHKNCQTHIIDTHDDSIIESVWDLYAQATARFSEVPLIIERDAAIPPLQELMDELSIAKTFTQKFIRQSEPINPQQLQTRSNTATQKHTRQGGHTNLKQFQIQFQSDILKNTLSMTDHIVSSNNLSAKERIHIYQNGYYARIIVAMKQDFPRLCEIIGESAFESLVCDYIETHPSQHYNLRTIGKNLAIFILSRDASFRYFSDLAAEEFYLIESAIPTSTFSIF